jgi:hypothetical protein
MQEAQRELHAGALAAVAIVADTHAGILVKNLQNAIRKNW